MPTVASAHNKALWSEDNKRDAHVALVGPAVVMVSIHVCRVRTGTRRTQTCSHGTQPATARIIARACWAILERARRDVARRAVLGTAAVITTVRVRARATIARAEYAGRGAFRRGGLAHLEACDM